jgi:hypothetical protein
VRNGDVGRAIFTHCGSPIVRADARKPNASIRRLSHEYGVDAQLACDGDRLAISYDGQRRRWMPNPSCVFYEKCDA